MPFRKRLCQAEVSKQLVCCYIFSSVTTLSWGIFLISVSLAYKDSLIWKEVCFFFGCIVSAGSFISLLVNLVILITKKMCCCQKHFVLCDSDNPTDTEEQLEPTNQETRNIISYDCNETSLRCEQMNTVSLVEEYSNVSNPSSSSFNANLSDLEVQSQHFYISPYENLPSIMHSSKMNLSVPITAEFSSQQKRRSNFPPDIPSVYFERSPKRKSSQELAAAPSQQSEACNRNLGTPNDLCMSGYETSHHNSVAEPLYENIQSVLCSSKIAHNTIPKEHNISGTSPSIYFNLENISPKNLTTSDKFKSKPFNEVLSFENTIPKELTGSNMPSARWVNEKTTVENTIPKEMDMSGTSSPIYFNLQNVSPKNLAASEKSKNKYFNKVKMVENTIYEEFALSDMSSVRYVNAKTAAENTIPKKFAFSRNSSSRHVSVKPAGENTIPKNVTEPSACSSIYANIVPKSKSIVPEDMDNTETSHRSRLI